MEEARLVALDALASTLPHASLLAGNVAPHLPGVSSSAVTHPDAAFIARIAPSAMLFIPCRDGKSHAPEEWTEPHQVASGAAALYEAVRLMDGQNR